MKQDNFTTSRIEGFKCPEGKHQCFFRDGKTPGLGVRVTDAGVKSYIFESRLLGKTSFRITIGNVRTWSLSKAQAEATRLKTLTDQGIDPRVQTLEKRTNAEKAKMELARQRITLGEVWPLYIEERKVNWSEGHLNNHYKLSVIGGEEKKKGKGKTKAAPLAALMPLTLAELSSEKISTWLVQEATERPTNSSQSYRLLRAFIRWADENPAYAGIIAVDAYNSRAVRAAIPKSKSKEGDCLQREQLTSWFQAVREIQNPIISAYFQTLLLTGARRRELSSLLWDDVDFRWRTLTLRDKVEGTRVIPLTPFVADLLSQLPRRNQWIFSSRTAADGKLTEPTMAHRLALQRAGLPHVTLHGLRRSFGTLCEWVQVPTGISAQIMGHKASALVEKHYIRRPIDLLRTWHEKIEEWVLSVAGITLLQG